MHQITWERGPNLPQGFQDSDGGFIGTHLVTVGGFCAGSGNEIKPGRYPRGFLSKAWAFDIADPRQAWLELPDYPATPRQGLMAVAVDDALYCWGGFNYTAPFTYADGHRLTSSGGAWSWEALPPLPQPLSAARGMIYIIGGTSPTPGNAYRCVVDNWRYDPERDAWQRLRDLPTLGSPFPDNQIVFGDRYLILVGGFQYSQIANPDGTSRPAYGQPHRFAEAGEYFNDVFVSDTARDLFGTADSLPINNCAPMVVVRGDDVFAIGGECDARVIGGEYYGHHPDLFLRGRIAESERASRRSQ